MSEQVEGQISAPAGQIPQSQALTEASEQSLAELFSRDPEGYQRQDRRQLVAALREHRARLEAAEASGTTKRDRTKLSDARKLESQQSAEELGL